MTDDVVYISDQMGLRRLERSRFSSEDELQSLLANHTQLLGGAQMDPGLRFLLVRREAGVPDSTTGGGRWSIDHLMVDQHAVPTIVEVKRSSDTRLRREVIGQLLEYAANATAYWRPGELAQLAAATHGDLLDARMNELMDDAVPEDFWSRVDANLADGRVRLLLVADVIPGETRRIIEFMNDHMPLLDVAAVEVAHYASDDKAAYVPRVFGQTERAKQTKAAQRGPGGKASAESFLASLPDGVAEWVTRLFEVARSKSYDLHWGTKGVSFRIERDGTKRSAIYLYPSGTYGNTFATVQVFLGQYAEVHHERVAELLVSRGFERVGSRTLCAPLRAAPTLSPPELLSGLAELLAD